MNEEGIINIESFITALIGLVIVAFISLLLYRRRNAKQKKIEMEAELLKKNKQVTNDFASDPDKNSLS